MLGISYISHPIITASSTDKLLFSLVPRDQPANGLVEVLGRYRGVTPHVKLAGPTSFAPLVYRACGIVQENQYAYHILVIFGDGELTRSSDTPDNALSTQERDTVDAIVAARCVFGVLHHSTNICILLRYILMQNIYTYTTYVIYTHTHTQKKV